MLFRSYDPSLIDSYTDAEGTRTTQGELLGYLPQELSDEDKNKTVYQYFSELQAFQTANPADYYRISSELGFREEMFYSSQAMSSLSGGERVKLQMAGILLAAPDILLLDEPTRGIDIGSKNEIYHEIITLAEQGKTIIMISSELPEVLGISDRIMVIHEGTVAAILDREEATQEQILSYAAGLEQEIRSK